MAKAYGFVEISGASAAIAALDIMCKTAGVQFVSREQKWGGRLVTMIICGDVAAVNAAIDAARNSEISPPVSWGILPNPHPEVLRLIRS